LAAAAVLSAAVAGCETLPVTGDYPELMQHGNTFYAAGRYKDALRAFDEAVRQAGDNPELVIAAAQRHGDAFCMLQFETARKDLDAGDERLALLGIDTAIAEPACVKFGPARVTFRARVELDLNDEAMTGSVTSRGKDSQGGTRFNAKMSFNVQDMEGEPGTTVLIKGENEISGKLAGLVEAGAKIVIKRMSAEFAENLQARVTKGA
jgi:carbon monoxide dehydrogenase subunit G